MKLEIPGESKKCVKGCPVGYQRGANISSPSFAFVLNKKSDPRCIRCETVKCPRGMLVPVHQSNLGGYQRNRLWRCLLSVTHNLSVIDISVAYSELFSAAGWKTIGKFS